MSAAPDLLQRAYGRLMLRAPLAVTTKNQLANQSRTNEPEQHQATENVCGILLLALPSLPIKTPVKNQNKPVKNQNQTSQNQTKTTKTNCLG